MMERSETALLRAVERGGMIVKRSGRYEVFRSQDARRGVAGCLPVGRVEALMQAGKLCTQSTDRTRIVAGANISLIDDAGTRRLAPSVPVSMRAQVSSSLLGKILDAEPNPRRREYIARAADRFLGDFERVNSGQTITMNWSFIPSGGRRIYRRGNEGGSAARLSAQRGLDQISAYLDRRDMQLVRLVLIGPGTLRRIATDCGVSVWQARVVGLEVLYRLARGYDLAVAAPRGEVTA